MKGTVTVRGTGVAPAQPDEVKMVLEISAQRGKPEEALSEVARRSEALSGILDELGIPADCRTTAGSAVVDVWEYDRQGNRSHAGYNAVNRLIVRLDEPSAIGKLMNEATEKASARIFGPWWHVAPDNPSRARACEQAASVARSKAEAYAAALGVRLGGILRITEPIDTEPLYEHRAVRAMAMAAETTEPEIPVGPGELEVTSTVEIKFRLEQE
jgi:uncharacterized protein YggE